MINDYEYLIKLLEEYTDPENQMDDQCMVRVTRSTNRDAQARKMLDILKNGRAEIRPAARGNLKLEKRGTEL